MFTGLIESVGVVAETVSGGAGMRLRVRTPLAADLRPGDSLAVNGVCLTVTTAADGDAQFDIGPETARVTTLGGLKTGSEVNLERAMRADSRFGGHFVQGHVDGVGRIDSLGSEAEFQWIGVTYPPHLARYVIEKGSIAVDGISLTIASLEANRFAIQVVPYTLSHTTLQAAAVGRRVNLECDMVGKYVVRAATLAGLTARVSQPAETGKVS
jgi:riboflavin synthase